MIKLWIVGFKLSVLTESPAVRTVTRFFFNFLWESAHGHHCQHRPGYEFAANADPATVFNTLCDVPKSARFPPKVDQLVGLGDGIYRWEMEEIGIAQISLQTIYASRYTANKAKGSGLWTPVPEEGNAQVSGSWKITGKKKSTHLVFQIQGEVTLPLPGLMNKMIARWSRLNSRKWWRNTLPS